MKCAICGEKITWLPIEFSIMERTRYRATVDIIRESVESKPIRHRTDFWTVDFKCRCPVCGVSLEKYITDEAEEKLRSLILRIKAKEV